MDLPVSPLAPVWMPDMPDIDGVDIATACSGTKYQNRDDVLVMSFPSGTIMAGVYTKNRCPGAPIDFNRNLGDGPIDTLVVNAGNANVFTGKAGAASVQKMADAAPGKRVTVSSTGVIGEPLDDDKMVAAVEAAAGGKSWIDAADTIRTTDTFAKYATASFTTESGETVLINGIAKGSGMIAPDMATMLAYIVTNAGIDTDTAAALLAPTCEDTFNSITVDSDQSTSDTLQLFATGQVPLTLDDLAIFKNQLHALCSDLSEYIIRDGEGATKTIHITVSEAQDTRSAKALALAVANSPLVKTAIAGEDANWGRIVGAVGKAGQPADRDALWIAFNGIVVAEAGQRHPDYDEEQVSASMKADNISISVGVGIGEGSASVLTCDLTHGYISINGDYRS